MYKRCCGRRRARLGRLAPPPRRRAGEATQVRCFASLSTINQAPACKSLLLIYGTNYVYLITVDSLITENEKKGVLMCIWQNKCRSQVSKKGVLEE